jgi:ferredoxin
MDATLVIDASLCDGCGLCELIAPAEFDAAAPSRPVRASLAALLAMADCPTGAIRWADPPLPDPGPAASS